jgi:hypothetical protein
VPDLVGVLGDRDANIFFGSVNIVEQAKLNRSGRFGKKGKVDAVAQPRRAQGIWITEPGPYRSHRCAAHLCGMERALAIANIIGLRRFSLSKSRLSRTVLRREQFFKNNPHAIA